MSENEDNQIENLKAFISLVNGLHQDRVVGELEEGLKDTEPLTQTPAPNTCHPAFTHAMDFVREFNKDHVWVTMAKRVSFNTMDDGKLFPDDVDIKKVLLTRRKCYGLVPFVGDPRLVDARYIWSVWVDEYGRYVAGEAELVWRTN